MRPSKYTPALVTEICERLSNAEPLAVICRDKHMPCVDTVRAWGKKRDDVSLAIAHARESGEDYLAAECLGIADFASNDYMEREGEGSEGYRLNGENIQRSKLRIDTRLKLLAKWNPKKWGEKVAIGGAEDLPAIKQDVNVTPEQAYMLAIEGKKADS